MQPIRELAAFHFTAGELIDDDHLAVLDDIFDIAHHDVIGFQRLLDIMHQIGVAVIVEMGDLEEPLGVHDAFFRQIDLTFLVIDFNLVFAQRLDELIGDQILLVQHFPGAGNDQRRAGFVDQHGVDFIDQRKMESAQNAAFQIHNHVVAQIIEAQLGVGRIGDVAGKRRALLRRSQSAVVAADAQPQKLINLSHPLGVAVGQIGVDGHDMHALAFQRVEVDGQN